MDQLLIAKFDLLPRGRDILYPSVSRAMKLGSTAHLGATQPRDHRWPRFERAFKLANPCCFICGGTKLIQIHHAKPFHLYPKLELEFSNFRSLCMAPGHQCHFIFGHQYRWSNYIEWLDEAIRWLRKKNGLGRLKIVIPAPLKLAA